MLPVRGVPFATEKESDETTRGSPMTRSHIEAVWRQAQANSGSGAGEQVLTTAGMNYEDTMAVHEALEASDTTPEEAVALDALTLPVNVEALEKLLFSLVQFD